MEVLDADLKRQIFCHCCELETKYKNILAFLSGAQMGLYHEIKLKNGGRTSGDTKTATRRPDSTPASGFSNRKVSSLGMKWRMQYSNDLRR